MLIKILSAIQAILILIISFFFFSLNPNIINALIYLILTFFYLTLLTINTFLYSKFNFIILYFTQTILSLTNLFFIVTGIYYTVVFVLLLIKNYNKYFVLKDYSDEGWPIILTPLCASMLIIFIFSFINDIMRFKLFKKTKFAENRY